MNEESKSDKNQQPLLQKSNSEVQESPKLQQTNGNQKKRSIFGDIMKKKNSVKIKEEPEGMRREDSTFENVMNLSEDDDEHRRRIMNRQSNKRFGHEVKFDRYKTSNLIKIICITLAIIIIPLEIFLESTLQKSENQMIVDVQHSFPPNETRRIIFFIPMLLVRVEVTLLFMFLFYLSTDSLIAFKSAILTCFGIYIITFLKLLYKDGRPFWLSSPVQGLVCAFDFSGPSYQLFIIVFFWCYNIIMYCMKYAESVNKLLVSILFGLLFAFSALLTFCGVYTGTVYIYQNIIGALYGVIFLVLCLNFDTEIHRMCEKTGFIVQSSRKYKFYLFFLCIGLFVICLIYYNSELDYWTMPQSWVVNASANDINCRQELLQNSNNRLGLDQTFFFTGVLFFITGMGFGTSFSLVYVDCLDWVHTIPIIRILRALIGGVISGLVYWGFISIPAHDNPTKYFFHFVVPALLLSFFIYGIFPVCCQKIGLVKVREAPSANIQTADTSVQGIMKKASRESKKSEAESESKAKSKGSMVTEDEEAKQGQKK